MEKEEAVTPEEVEALARQIDVLTDRLLDIQIDNKISKNDFVAVRELVRKVNGRSVRATPALRTNVIQVLERVEYLLRVLLLKMKEVLPPDVNAPEAAIARVRNITKLQEVRRVLGGQDQEYANFKSKSLRPVLRMKTLTFNNLGVLHSKNGNHNKALNYLLRTLELELEAGLSKYQIATTCLNITVVLSKLGRHKQALENCANCVSILRNLIQDQEKSRDAENLLTESPYPEETSRVLEEGEQKQKGIEELKWKYAVGLNNMAVQHQYLGHYGAAEELYQEAANISKELFGERDQRTQVFQKNYQEVKQTARGPEATYIQLSSINSAYGISSKRSSLFKETRNSEVSEYQDSQITRPASRPATAKIERRPDSYTLLDTRADQEKFKLLEREGEKISKKTKIYQIQKSKHQMASWGKNVASSQRRTSSKISQRPSTAKTTKSENLRTSVASQDKERFSYHKDSILGSVRSSFKSLRSSVYKEPTMPKRPSLMSSLTRNTSARENRRLIGQPGAPQFTSNPSQYSNYKTARPQSAKVPHTSQLSPTRAVEKLLKSKLLMMPETNIQPRPPSVAISQSRSSLSFKRFTSSTGNNMLWTPTVAIEVHNEMYRAAGLKLKKLFEEGRQF